jgi:hypothetical protein
LADITFTNGSLTGIRVYSPPYNRFIGSQLEDQINPIVARLVIFNGDPCDINTIDDNSINGSAVMVMQWGICSPEVANDVLVRKGALAIIGRQIIL